MAVRVATEPTDRLGRGDVPKEGGAVAADGGEALVVGGDGEVEDLVAVGGVGLNEAAFRDDGLGGSRRLVAVDG